MELKIEPPTESAEERARLQSLMTEFLENTEFDKYPDEAEFMRLTDDDDDDDEPAARADLALWERKALNRIRSGKGAACEFMSDAIPGPVRRHIEERLAGCVSNHAVRALFSAAAEMEPLEAEERTEWAARVHAELKALANAD